MLLKNALVFLHLLAMALAVGKMLEYDFRFLRHAGETPTPARQAALLDTRQVMSWSLLVLWVTGLALLGWGRLESQDYLDNQKLWMKVFTVCCLTLNGMLMHHIAFPLLQRGHAFLDLPLRQTLGLTVFAAISSVSWLYAAFLGVARAWNHSASFSHMLVVYLVILSAAGLGGSLLLGVLHHRHNKGEKLAGDSPCGPGLPAG